MKKFGIILCIFAILLSTMLTGCGKEEDADYTNPHIISFSMTNKELKQFNGQIVQIIGYQTITSNIEESIEYLVNKPGMFYPETEIDNITLKNTFPIYVDKIPSFTSMPVVVTGKLVFGNFSDGYGTYSYDFKIENPRIRVAEKEDVPINEYTYYDIAREEAPFELVSMLYTADGYINYKNYELDPEIDLKTTISLASYNLLSENLKNNVDRTKHEDFFDMWDKMGVLLKNINECVEAKHYETLSELKEDFDEINIAAEKYFNKFIIQ